MIKKSLMESSDYHIPLRNHLVGWLSVFGKSNKHDIKDKVNNGLNSFVGDYGLRKEIKTSDGFGFGFWKPEKPKPLTTWSFFEDKEKTCFIEGGFYDENFCDLPTNGENKLLAETFLREFNGTGEKAIEKLNGAFSGFIFDNKNKKLTTFIDRLGARILYWSNEKNDIIVSSNLAAFRSLKSLSMDYSAAFQFLTIGFPISERTLLKDVNIHLPCTMNIFNGTERKTVRYWNVPERINGISLNESVQMITNAMEDFVDRIYNRTKQKLGLALSGGHDSRLILSALCYKNVPFVSINQKLSKFDANVAQDLTASISEKLLIIREASDEELTEIRNNTFVYTDGAYLHPTGFSRIAKECFEHKIEYLMLGFAGGPVSGSTSILAPQYLHSIKELANSALNKQMEQLSFKQAQLLLNHANSDIIDETGSEWINSFSNAGSFSNNLDTAIWQGIYNRNFKRVRFALNPTLQYVQTIYPYLDNKIMDVYFKIPIQFLSFQKAHCSAGFYRFKEFGNYQACNYPISLRKEASYPLLLCLGRFSYSRLKRILSWLQPTYKGNWSSVHMNIYNEIFKSPLFNSVYLKEIFSKKQINPNDLYKIHTLSRFYDFYVCGNDNFIPHEMKINL